MATKISKEQWEEYKKTLPDRTSYRIFRYFEIVQKNYEICMEYKAKEEAKKDDSSSVHISVENYMENEYSEIKVIVFSALFLEAVINDYGASNRPDIYTNKKLNNMSFISKWEEIPKMITGKEFPRDSQAFGLLKKLKDSRNRLIHYKTKEIPKTYEEFVKFIQNEKLELIDVDDAHKCIAECLLELSKIDNTKWHLFTSETFSRITSGEVI